ncbi:MAG: hypothetical protein CMF67_00075 [Magnetovibrio sp.]|nr:hypothetical protein [Magnetovibrio sp.]
MFGFSIMKILFTIAIVVVVWQGFKWLKRRETVEAVNAMKSLNRESASARDHVEELVPCPDCGAYIAKGPDHRCTQLSCPFIN